MLYIFVVTVVTLLMNYLLPGLYVESFWSALLFALIFGLINATLGQIIKFAGCALNLLTLGLFNLLVNGLIVYMASGLIGGIDIQNYFWAIVLALIISLFTTYFSREEAQRRTYRR